MPEGTAGPHLLSLVIPTYNEAATLPALWERLQKVAWPCPVEFVLVDDGSTDGSREVIGRLEAPRVQRILQERNQGKTAALLAGIAAATGTVIAVQDADLEYDPDDLPRLVRPILEDRADAVYGSRFRQTSEQVHRTWHRLGIRVLTFASNVLTGIYLTDLEGCYKAWRSDLLKHVIVTSRGFDFDPEVTAKISKLRVRLHEVPISYFPRRYEEGKKIRWVDGLTALWTLLRCSWFTGAEASFRPGLPEKYRRR